MLRLVEQLLTHNHTYPMTRKPTFKDRRMKLIALVDDAENMAADLARHAVLLQEAARFLTSEAQAMERAEARFAQRSDTKKAAFESRPHQPTN